jgi:hypothetical protein
MDDLTPVSLRHGVGNDLEKFETRAQSEASRPAVLIYVEPFDTLRDEKREAIRRAPSVEETHDIRVDEVAKSLTFHAEPRDSPLGRVPVRRPVRDLDRDLLLELVIRTLSVVDVAHAAGAQQPDDAVGKDDRSGFENCEAGLCGDLGDSSGKLTMETAQRQN